MWSFSGDDNLRNIGISRSDRLRGRYDHAEQYGIARARGFIASLLRIACCYGWIHACNDCRFSEEKIVFDFKKLLEIPRWFSVVFLYLLVLNPAIQAPVLKDSPEKKGIA